MKTNLYPHQGYEVIRFWNHEVLENTDDVLRVIAEQCGSPDDLIE